MFSTNMDEKTLIEKLVRIEALFAGAATAGERDAAQEARERILRRLHALEQDSPPLEFRFSFPDHWSRKLFVTLLRRYNLRPYRYSRQRQNTVMVRVPKRFVDDTLWPEFKQLSQELHTYLDEAAERIISQVVNQDVSEAVEVPEPLRIPPESNQSV